MISDIYQARMTHYSAEGKRLLQLGGKVRVLLDEFNVPSVLHISESDCTEEGNECIATHNRLVLNGL
jgi:hypothetical protein